jgi:hypothetical protein
VARPTTKGDKVRKQFLALASVLALAVSVAAPVAGAHGGGSPASPPALLQTVLSRAHNALECLSQWQTLYKADGTSFPNVVDCVVYAAEGGQFGSPPPPPPPAGPTITSVTWTGCYTYEVDGSGFTGATQVVGGGALDDFTVVSDAEITASTPPGVGNFGVGGTVTVSTPAGSASAAVTGSTGSSNCSVEA